MAIQTGVLQASTAILGFGLILVCGLLFAACGEPGANFPASTAVRDSLGIEIVDHAGGPNDLPHWETAVDLEIGTPSGTAGTQNGPTRTARDSPVPFGYIADVAVDGDGRIYVLDQQGGHVRVFSELGEPLTTLGRLGEGPGELSRFATDVLTGADTVYVADWAQRRLIVMDPSGQLEASRAIPGAGGARSWWRLTPGGQLWFRRLARAIDAEGRWRTDDLLLRVGRDWATTDTVLAFEYTPTDLGGPGNVRVPVVVNSPLWALLSDEVVAWTTLEDAELRFHSADGALVRIVRHPSWQTRAPTAADQAGLVALLRDKLTVLGGDPDGLDQLPVIQPDVLPAITALHADDGDRLWVQRMGAVADVHPMGLNSPDPPTGWGGRLWDVLDREGRRVATAELPARFRVTRIVGGFLYGVVRDELDLETVVRLRLLVGS